MAIPVLRWCHSYRSAELFLASGNKIDIKNEWATSTGPLFEFCRVGSTARRRLGSFSRKVLRTLIFMFYWHRDYFDHVNSSEPNATLVDVFSSLHQAISAPLNLRKMHLFIAIIILATIIAMFNEIPTERRVLPISLDVLLLPSCYNYEHFNHHFVSGWQFPARATSSCRALQWSRAIRKLKFSL